MGGGSYSAPEWASFTKTRVAGKKAEHVYTSRSAKSEFDPKNILIREARDSTEHPNSTPIILGLDVTGSMTPVLMDVVNESLPTLVRGIYSRKTIEDPQIMLAAIGDVIAGDRYPLQVTQFESDVRILEQLVQLYLERAGGGNDNESYSLLWHFAATKTELDCIKKGRKGFLFTIGDECPTEPLHPGHFETIYGPGQYKILTSNDLYKMASKNYNVYHMLMEEGSNYRDHNFEKWTDVMGQNVIKMSDYKKLGEIIISLIEYNNGKSKEEIVNSWDGSTAVVISHALNGLTELHSINGTSSISLTEF